MKRSSWAMGWFFWILQMLSTNIFPSFFKKRNGAFPMWTLINMINSILLMTGQMNTTSLFTLGQEKLNHWTSITGVNSNGDLTWQGCETRLRDKDFRIRLAKVQWKSIYNIVTYRSMDCQPRPRRTVPVVGLHRPTRPVHRFPGLLQVA